MTGKIKKAVYFDIKAKPRLMPKKIKFFELSNDFNKKKRVKRIKNRAIGYRYPIRLAQIW